MSAQISYLIFILILSFKLLVNHISFENFIIQFLVYIDVKFLEEQ